MRARPAFTLFELILAVALSATLLALIGTAINLYLLRVDAGRTRVEEAQLARSILATIAADVRAASTYQTQDISAIAELASSVAQFDVDDLDAEGDFQGAALGTPGSTGSAGTAASGSTSSSPTFGGSSIADTQNTTGMAPGLNGTLQELIVDVARLPRLNELFPAMPQQSNTTLTAAANAPRPSDVKTVRYFIRQGGAVDPSDPAVTGLSPQAQLSVGGLVRQTIDRSVRDMAEQSGNSQLLNSGQALLAPEVTRIEFRYFDGSTAVDLWDMQERSAMPTAIEVRIWLDPAGAVSRGTATTMPMTNEHMYIQTIDLPLALAAGSTAAAQSAGAQSTQGSSSESQDGAGGSGNQLQ
jgi:type II secretory pathway pseudopilin PulG